MSDLADYIQRVFIDPTDPVTVAQDTAANLKAQVELAADQTIQATQDDPEDLKVEIHQPAAKEAFEVIQDTPADLKATVTQAAIGRIVGQIDPEDLKVEIHQPTAKEAFEVIQDTPADLKATVTQAAKDRTVTNPTPANLKAQIFPGANAGPIPVGKIPDDGTQVAISGDINNDTAVLHTVTTLTTFYLTDLIFSVLNASGAVNYGDLFVTNAANTTQYIISHIYDLTGTYHIAPLSFPCPLEIPAGWKVKIFSSAADIVCSGFIHGYEA